MCKNILENLATSYVFPKFWLMRIQKWYSYETNNARSTSAAMKYWQTSYKSTEKIPKTEIFCQFESSKIRKKRICQTYCALGILRNWVFCKESLGQCWRWRGETLFNFQKILKVSESYILERILAIFLEWKEVYNLCVSLSLWWYLQW